MQEKPTFFTGQIAAISRGKRPFFIVGAVVTLVVGFLLLGIGANTEIEGGGKGESGRAFELLDERFETAEGAPSEVIVFSHPTLTVDDDEYREVVEGLMLRLRQVRVVTGEQRGTTSLLSSTRIVSSTVTHYDIGAPREVSPFVVAGESGGDVSFASATLEGELAESAAASVPAAIDSIELVVDEVAAWQEASPGFTISIGGDASSGKQSDDLLQEDFGIASTFSLPITLVIMLLATGVLLSATFPIILAFASIFVSLGILALISQVFPLEAIYIQVVLFMGLAAGIDYSLFLIMRYRCERLEDTEAVAYRESLSPQDAIVRGWSNTGKNVFIAATTTVLALLGMFFVGDPVFSSLAIAAILVILMSWAMATVFLPAFTGEAMRRFRLPWLGRTHIAGVASFINPLATRIVAFSWRNPLPVTIVAGAALVVLALPLFSLNLAFNGAAALHDDIEAKAAFLSLEENFTLGLTAPARVVVDAGKNQNVFDEQIQEGVARLEAGVAEANRAAEQAGEHVPFGLPISFEINDAGDTEVISVPLNADIGDQEAFDAVNLLRGELVPAAFDETPAQQALVTGASAGNLDFKDNIVARTPIVLGFVIISAFITLLIMYRSPLIAFLGVTMNGLAIASSYGILVLVFQEGYALEGLLNFEATGIIESWLPLFVFSILFGISMDYITFAMGRVKELHDGGMSTDEAILEGTRGGFGTVFSAALIMIAVAGIFAFMRNIGIQQFGFAVAVAVLIDATIILAVLIPAAARLAGDHLWWLPRWLEWLPGGPHAKQP